MWLSKKIGLGKHVETDTELLCRLLRDDETAFTQIYQRYQQMLHTICLRYIKDEDTSKDVVQHVFLQLWENRKDLAIDVSLQNYLFTMAKNRILNLLRHENLAMQKNYEYAQERESDETWLEKMEKEGQIRMVREHINALPEQRRQICLMKIDQRKTNQQIADELGISLQTVKNQYSSAIKTLREEMANEKNQEFLRLG